MQTKQRVSLRFTRLSDLKVIETAEVVSANLYAEEFFNDPPVTKTAFDAAILEFSDAKAATAQGGTAATAFKDAKRRELLALMEELALYVQIKSANDLSRLLSSGFDAVKPRRPSAPLAKPEILRIKNGQAGQTLVTVKPDRNARGYEGRHAKVTEEGSLGPWISMGFHTSSRNIPADDLVSGQVYAYQVRAMGGSTSHSDWSDTMAHRAY
jgi:hypothetical protein